MRFSGPCSRSRYRSCLGGYAYGAAGGSWVHGSQPGSRIPDRDSTWVEETVEASLRLNKLRLSNANNSAGYEWSATCSLVDTKYLLGTWVSDKTDAHSSGTVSLVISPQGNYMFGNFSGPNDRGNLMSGGFALGRTNEDVSMALDALRASRVKFPRTAGHASKPMQPDRPSSGR